MTIDLVKDVERRYAMTKHILEQLPDWFGIPEALEEYCVECRKDIPYLAVTIAGESVGFLALKPLYPTTDELHVTGVLPAFHRKGVGSALIKAAFENARSRGVQFITVKTLDASANYEPYDRTRNFYLKHGFVPLEMFPKMWDESNPCLFLVKYLG